VSLNVAENASGSTVSKQACIARLLRPRSVAVVGASEKRGSLGASVLANLDVAQYAGAIHLINPDRTEIRGIPCLRSVADLPDDVDCFILARHHPYR